MTRTVADAAIMLGVMEGAPDPNDPRTSECTAPPNHDYTPFLKVDALKGTRIGIPRAGFYEARTFPGQARPFAGLKPDEMAVMNAAITALEGAGAEVVDPADLPSMTAPEPARNLMSHSICELPFTGKASDDLCSIVLRYGMKRDFNRWLATLGDAAPVKSLTALREWNRAHKDQGAIRYGQGRLDFADAVDLDKDRARFERNRREDLTLTREDGLDAAINAHQLDALLFPGSSGANYATKAGYPIIVVPIRNDDELRRGRQGFDRQDASLRHQPGRGALPGPEAGRNRLRVRAGDPRAGAAAPPPVATGATTTKESREEESAPLRRPAGRSHRSGSPRRWSRSAGRGLGTSPGSDPGG